MNCIKTKKNKAFTLVELLVVIAIVAILATVSVIGYTSFVKKAANSNDNVLAKQINTLIEGQKVYEDIDTENDIAKLLQQHFGTSVQIASEKYGMNIYYNTDSNRFELMSNETANSYNYKTINELLSLEIVDNTTPDTPDVPNDNPNPDDAGESEEPDAPNIEDPTTPNISINKQTKLFDIVLDSDSQQQNMKLYFENDDLYIDICDSKSPIVDLSTIVTAADDDGNPLDIIFNLFEIETVESPAECKITSGCLLEIHTAGKYQIKYTCQDIEGTINLHVKNIYWPLKAELDISEVTFTYKASKNTITVKTNELKISEYNINDGQRPTEPISNVNFLCERMNIILVIDGEEVYTRPMNSSTTEYKIGLDDYELTDDSTIEIKFRYLSYNGEYVSSEARRINIK